MYFQLESEKMARILLVEDDEAYGFLLTEALTAEGHEVVRLTRGDDVTPERLAAEGFFDAAIVDIFLPGRTGVDVALALIEMREQVGRTVVLTVLNGDEVPEELRSKVDLLLHKPAHAIPEIVNELGELIAERTP